MEKNVKKKKRKLSERALSAVLAVGILFGGIFHSTDATDGPGSSLPPAPPAIVQTVYPDLDDSDNGAPEETDEERKRRGGFSRLVSRIPKLAIPFIGAAFWAVCWFGVSALAGAWLATLPLWTAALIKACLCAVISAAAVLVTAKLFFPGLKAKEIFSRGRVTGALIGAVLVACSAVFLEEAGLPRLAVRLITAAEGVAVILGELWSLRRQEMKKEKEAGK